MFQWLPSKKKFSFFRNRTQGSINAKQHLNDLKQLAVKINHENPIKGNKGSTKFGDKNLEKAAKHEEYKKI